MLHIGGRSTVVHKKTQPGTRFTPIVHKSEPSNEGHFARGGFFFLPLFFFFLPLSFFFFFRILPSWAEGLFNQNQTQVRMWGTHSSRTSVLHRGAKQDELRVQPLSFVFDYHPASCQSERERSHHWDGCRTHRIRSCRGCLVRAEESCRMESACSTFPGGCPSPEFLTKFLFKIKNYQRSGMHFAFFNIVHFQTKSTFILSSSIKIN